MHAREWALVAFTLLMQSSVGTLLVAIAAPVITGRGAQPSSHAIDAPLAVAAAAGVLALVASLFHLGHPGQAWLALTHARSSWLSREIALSALFTVLMLASMFERERRGAIPVLIAAAVGVLALYAMSRLYMVPAQPAWNSLATLGTFASSALLLGSLVVITTSPADPALVRRLTVAAIVLVMIQGVLAAVSVRGMPAEPAAAISVATVAPGGPWLTAARLATGAIAIALLAIAVLTGVGFGPSPVGILAIAFVVVSELLGRMLFYAGRVSLGPF